MIPMGLHQKQTHLKLSRNSRKNHRKPWAPRCPGVLTKTANIRPLAAARTNSPLSANKTDKRPLAAQNQNKPLSATTGKRAMKLRKPKNDKLRKRNTSATALSKKVNKVISVPKQGQSKTGIPRAKNTKVLRTKIASKIARKISQTKKTKEFQEHESALGLKQGN